MKAAVSRVCYKMYLLVILSDTFVSFQSELWDCNAGKIKKMWNKYPRWSVTRELVPFLQHPPDDIKCIISQTAGIWHWLWPVFPYFFVVSPPWEGRQISEIRAVRNHICYGSHGCGQRKKIPLDSYFWAWEVLILDLKHFYPNLFYIAQYHIQNLRGPQKQ